MKGEEIEVRGLEVFANIGVPASERGERQRLLLDVEIEAEKPFAEMEDEIEATVDYYKVTRGLIVLAAEKPRKLIETLAVDCARWVLENYPARRVAVRVRKFILSEAEWVGVRTEVVRERNLSGEVGIGS